MKNSVFFLFLSSIKYSALVIFLTALASLIPIDIFYYFLNLENSPMGQTDVLPLMFLCPISLVVAITYAIPVVLGLGIVGLIIGLLRTRVSKKSIGRFVGGVVGAVTFALGTNVFLKATGNQDLENWVFFMVMTLWGVCVFSLIGHRIEFLY